MPTTYGSALFKTFVPERNAAVIERLQAAGAIILAKTNLGESPSPIRARPSRLPQRLRSHAQPERLLVRDRRRHRGQFRHGRHREDTGGSVRGLPLTTTSWDCGRPLQLVSRAGMFPATPTRDTLGPSPARYAKPPSCSM